MKPRLNVWIESDDCVVLSFWRVRLLEAIRETGSISAAAQEMDVPYRTAWSKIHEMEAGLGVQLVDSQTGGPGGGGTELTADAERMIERFYALTAGFSDQLQERFEELFAAPGNRTGT